MQATRECHECGKVMTSGFVADCVPYCTEACLHKHFTPEEWADLYEEEPDLYYWTDWVA